MSRRLLLGWKVGPRLNVIGSLPPMRSDGPSLRAQVPRMDLRREHMFLVKTQPFVHCRRLDKLLSSLCPLAGSLCLLPSSRCPLHGALRLLLSLCELGPQLADRLVWTVHAGDLQALGDGEQVGEKGKQEEEEQTTLPLGLVQRRRLVSRRQRGTPRQRTALTMRLGMGIEVSLGHGCV